LLEDKTLGQYLPPQKHKRTTAKATSIKVFIFIIRINKKKIKNYLFTTSTYFTIIFIET
jgi:hypothetical protein